MKPPEPDVVVAIAIALSMLGRRRADEHIDSPWKNASRLSTGDEGDPLARTRVPAGRRWAYAGRLGM